MPLHRKAPPASSKTLSADHKHLSALIIALIILCCVGSLVTYYKIDSDYANQSGDFNHLELRLSDLSLKMTALSEKMDAMNKPAVAPSGAMPTTNGMPYTMPTPGSPNNK